MATPGAAGPRFIFGPDKGSSAVLVGLEVAAVDWSFAGAAECLGCCCAKEGNVLMRMKAEVVVIARNRVLRRMDVISHGGWRIRSTIDGSGCNRRIKRPGVVNIAGAVGLAGSTILILWVGRIVTRPMVYGREISCGEMMGSIGFIP